MKDPEEFKKNNYIHKIFENPYASFDIIDSLITGKGDNIIGLLKNTFNFSRSDSYWKERFVPTIINTKKIKE